MNTSIRYEPKRQKGFSLLELVVVLAIMCALFAIVGLQWKTWMTKYNVEADVKKVKLALTYEQVLAVNHSKTHFETFLTTSIQPVEDTDENGILDATPPDTAGQPIMLKTAINASSNSIIIDKKGIISSPTSSVLDNPVTIKFSSNTGAEYDCILVYSTIIRAARQNTGGGCDPM